ncbi:hypothetical protein AQUSIP_11780 [Aquicella siphonis]|uniref:Uncharacterized protein n=1 Tax=Aquicella siphonis TaxID=254247 RepID=A0A5E4PHF2_9COXI|nr:hypothetical protein AQUSIP_11780 [Aquicella siphonis]
MTFREQFLNDALPSSFLLPFYIYTVIIALYLLCAIIASWRHKPDGYPGGLSGYGINKVFKEKR